ncbi:MAG: hypothetical protein P1P90_06730 [Patescibacteria group bacterium]|nr:hypothetical protein [Patescibacteria group bacterium]
MHSVTKIKPKGLMIWEAMMDQAQAEGKAGTNPPVHTSGSVMDMFFDNIQRRYITIRREVGTEVERRNFNEAMDLLANIYFTCSECNRTDCAHSFNLLEMFSKALLELRGANLRRDQLELELGRIKKERESLTERVKQSESARDGMKARIGALEVAAKQHRFNHEQSKQAQKDLKKQNEEQKVLLGKREIDLKSLRDELITQQSELEVLRQKLKEQAATIGSLEDMATAPAPSASIPPATSAAVAELDHAMQMAADAEIAFASERKALSQALEEASQKLVESEIGRQVAQSRLQELEEQIIALRDAKDVTAAELEFAKIRLSQAETKFEESAQMRFNELNKKINTVSLERDQLTKRVRELKAEYEKQQQEALCAKRGLSNQLVELTEHLNKLREKHEETLGALSRQKVLVAELEELATAPSSDSDELKRALATNHEAEARATKLEQEVSCLREAFDKTKANLEEINFELMSLRTERMAIQNTVKQRQDQIVTLEAEIRSLQSASKDASEHHKQLQALLDQREHDAERIEELANELARASSELSSSKSALADLEQSTSKVPDPLAETKLVLAKLDSIKADLETRISSIPPAQTSVSSNSPLFAPSERVELEKKISEWQSLKHEIAAVSEDVYEVVQEHKKCANRIEMRTKDTVDPLSPDDIVLAKQEIIDREAEMALLMSYLQETAQPLTQVAERNITLLVQRLAIHSKLEDESYRSALATAIPALPDPPFVYEDEDLEDDHNDVEVSAEEPDDVKVSFDRAYIDEISEQSGLQPLELLLVALFEMVPNAQKLVSFTRLVNSAIKAGILKAFNTSNRELQKVWMDGKLEDRKIGQWIRYSGTVNRAPIYRRTSTDLAWNIDHVINQSVRTAFVAAYHSYANGAKKS